MARPLRACFMAVGRQTLVLPGVPKLRRAAIVLTANQLLPSVMSNTGEGACAPQHQAQLLLPSCYSALRRFDNGTARYKFI